MKLQDLVEKYKVIQGDVVLLPETTRLNYEGVIVRGSFNCASTKITSLKGSPSHVDGHFNCHTTKIKSLEGAPSYVGGRFRCYNTNITSLHNIHKQIKHIGSRLVVSGRIQSNVIGVMLIKGLKKIDFVAGLNKQIQVETIINKHLAGDRDVHQCQEELIEAGLGEYAKL